jgi:hypothetical protein
MKNKIIFISDCEDLPFVDITELLAEIEKRFHGVRPELKRIVIQARDGFLHFSYPLGIVPEELPTLRTMSRELFDLLSENLRLCGIAPAGWRQHDPDEQVGLRPNLVCIRSAVARPKAGQAKMDAHIYAGVETQRGVLIRVAAAYPIFDHSSAVCCEGLTARLLNQLKKGAAR